jgi:Protein of unknown function (DUF3747)
MKQIRALMAGASVALLPCIFQPSLAVTFGQTQVSQTKLIAIAVPHASGYYSLIVLEQLSDKKPCWRESGSKPTQVDPLLVNFNFTGICGRSTDSNGYSLRVAGQDLGMTHRLSLQKRDGDLVLLGMPSSEKIKPVEVGRTHGIRPGFLKIDLSPGWQFAKRTYSGKTLGHVYISRGTPAPTYQAAQPSSSKLSDSKLSSGKLPDSKPSDGKAPDKKVSERLPAKAKPSSKSSDVAAKPSRPALVSGKPTRTSATPGQNRKPQAPERLPAKAKPSSKSSDIAAKPSRPASVSDKTTRTSATAGQNRKPQAAPTPLVSLNPPSLLRRHPLSSRPSRINPIQPVRNKPRSSQPPSAQPNDKLYQVMVIAIDSAQQDKLRNKMPNAFRTSYKGKTVMQVGLFNDRRKAESLKTDLKREGFKVLLTQKQVGKTAVLSESEGSAIASDASTGIGTSDRIGASNGSGSITVPGADAPIGNAKGAQNIYQPQGYLAKASTLPPPPPKTADASQFRVIVLAQSDDQQAKVRSLVPDAFLVRFKGQSAMQVGSFPSTAEADPIVRLMEQHGFTPLTDRT